MSEIMVFPENEQQRPEKYDEDMALEIAELKRVIKAFGDKKLNEKEREEVKKRLTYTEFMFLAGLDMQQATLQQKELMDTIAQFKKDFQL